MYVLQVISGKEDSVYNELKNIGFKALIPKVYIYTRKAKKWEKTLNTLFKGYVFIDIDYNAENYYKIKEITGVVGFLRNDTLPLSISKLEEEWVKILSSFENRDITKIGFDEFKKAYVIDGSLKHFESKITKVDKHKRSVTFEIKLLDELRTISLGVDFEDDDTKDLEEVEVEVEAKVEDEVVEVKKTKKVEKVEKVEK